MFNNLTVRLEEDIPRLVWITDPNRALSITYAQTQNNRLHYCTDARVELTMPLSALIAA